MEPKITYKKLMAKVEDGYAEINSWTGDGYQPVMADVTFYKANGTSVRKTVYVTSIPADIGA